MTEEQHLRIIVTREDGMFVAQCLEFDICTQARDFDTLRERMDFLIAVELGDGQHLDSAPERFHKMWDDAKSVGGDHEYRLAA